MAFSFSSSLVSLASEIKGSWIDREIYPVSGLAGLIYFARLEVMNGWSCRRICALVFLAAFAVRVGLILATGSYRDPERDEVVRIATSLATQGTFADAYCNGCGPTAHTAPVYPLLLSLIYRLFGVDVAGTFAQEVFSSLLASLQYALVPYVAEVCGMCRLAGLLGGLLGALLPINRWVQTKGNFEYALSGLLCVIITAAVIRTWQKRDFSARRGVLLGLLWGITLLTAPQFVLPMIVLLAYPYLNMPAARERYWIFVTAQAAVVIICLAPWTIRNLKVLGSPVWSRSNLGLELNLSNNNEATAVWQDNLDNGLFTRMHPFTNGTELRRLREAGEVRYNKEQLRIARHWIASHPARFAELTAQRVFYFWISPLRRRGQTIVLAVVTVLGFLGFFYYVRRGSFCWQYFLLLWFFFPLPAYLFQQSGRMRYPIEWTSFLFAGYWLVSVARGSLNRKVLLRASATCCVFSAAALVTRAGENVSSYVMSMMSIADFGNWLILSSQERDALTRCSRTV